jgi:hypothetical protein
MNEPLDPTLERTAGAVADDADLDWEVESARHPDLRASLAGLRTMQRLAAAHRDARLMHERAEGALRAEIDRLAAEQGRAVDPALQRPAFTWGFLRALEPIGAGSFGEVWRAWDSSLEREVALKLRRLAPPGESGTPVETTIARTGDPATRHRLIEARQLARVRHPNVLVVHGAAEHDGRAGLWTELVRGETLEHRLARVGKIAPREAARIGRDLCSALAAVHAAGLVHGDVKAANVMLEPPSSGAGARERVVLMDFGAAHQSESAVAGALAVAGTPLAMAPEVLAGEAATPAADLYAVGALLYRLVTGKHAVDAASLDDLLARHRRGEQPRPAALRAAMPAPLARAVSRSLARSPGDRFASAGEFARALDAFADPARGRRHAAIAVGVALAVLAAAATVFVVLRQPAALRYVPPEHLPGAHTEAMVLADALVGSMPGEFLGSCEAGVGDVNGDGYDDIVIASSHWSGAHDFQGRVQLYLGNAAGKFGAPAWSYEGRSANDYLGARVAPAGDVNHDGYADVLVTDLHVRESDRQQVGTVLLFLGGPNGLSKEPAARIESPQAPSQFGGALTGVGDVNGDGYDDVVVGAVSYTHKFLYEGAAFLYLGGPHGLSTRPAWAAYGGARDAWLGWLFSRTGDVNGDGYADVLLSAVGWKGEHTGVVGCARLYLGGPHGLATTPVWTGVGDQAGGSYGYSVGGVGDVNQDGYDDFVVMQSGWSGRSIHEGRLLLYLGGPHGPGARPAWTVSGFGSNTWMSSGSPWIGDVNGDGRPDIMVGSGAYAAGPDRRQLGIAGVFLSPSDPRHAHPAWYWAGRDPGTPIGSWGYRAGDFNGDGLADQIVSQPGWFNGDLRGRVLLFLGRKTPPVH